MKKYLIDIYNTINKLPAANQRARLHEPFFFGKEKEYLNDYIQTTFVSHQAGTQCTLHPP